MNSDSIESIESIESIDNIETETDSENEFEFARDDVEPNTDNLTAQEAADFCKIMDPEEYGDAIAEMDASYIESILNKVAHVTPPENFGPMATEISTKELAAIIDIQEGRKPKCSPEVLAASFNKIASGTVIDLNDENINDDHGILVVKQPWWKFWCCWLPQPEDGPDDSSSEDDSSDSDYY